MTAKEALESLIIKAQPYESGEGDVIKQALTELEELKKRDMAMKPAEAMITWQCGNCGEEVRNTFNSCPYCRTRIDWSGIYGSAKDE